MNLPTLPEPWRTDADGEEHYSPMCMQAYGQQCREQALLDAMNATTPFGKTGAVIAAAIGALK